MENCWERYFSGCTEKEAHNSVLRKDEQCIQWSLMECRQGGECLMKRWEGGKTGAEELIVEC
jgi:hypothetical protein